MYNWNWQVEEELEIYLKIKSVTCYKKGGYKCLAQLLLKDF